MIPAEAVEAVVTHLYPGWETSPADWKDYFRRKATEALEAAAPYMHREWLDTNKQGEK